MAISCSSANSAKALKVYFFNLFSGILLKATSPCMLSAVHIVLSVAVIVGRIKAFISHSFSEI